MEHQIHDKLIYLIRRSYSLIELLNKKKILKQDLINKKYNSNEIVYTIIPDSNTSQCKLLFEKNIKDEKIKTFSNNFDCPTLVQFDHFTYEYSDILTNIDRNNFKFTVRDKFYLSLVNSDILNSRYKLNTDINDLLKKLNHLAEKFRTDSILTHIEENNKLKIKMNFTDHWCGDIYMDISEVNIIATNKWSKTNISNTFEKLEEDILNVKLIME